MQINDMQRLAVAVALEKVARRVTRTGDPGNLRGAVDEDMRRDWEEKGATQRRVTLGDAQVATITAKVSSPTVRRRIVIRDYNAFRDWFKTDAGLDLIINVMCSRDVDVLTDHALDMTITDGIAVPDGCEIVEESTPARFGGTQVRVNEEAVATALGAALPDAVMDAFSLPA